MTSLLEIVKVNENPYVVFDLDDTLYKEIDFLKSGFKKIIATYFEEFSECIYQEMLTWYYNKSDVFKNLIIKYKLEIEVDEILKLYRSHVPFIELDENTKNVLTFLVNNKIKLGLITDGFSTTQRNKLKALGIIDIFELIIISEEVGTNKPDIINYKFFYEKEHSAMHKFLYVGDNYNKDFVSPNKLGWLTVGVIDNGLNIHKQNRNLLEDFLPQYEIPNL